MGKVIDVRERFDAGYLVDPSTGCWMWQRSLDRGGYGKLWVDGRLEKSHRISWRLHVGDIPDGQCVLHRCDTRACVNPAHLFLGTKAENNADMVGKGRQVMGETHGNVKLSPADVIAIREDRHRSASAIGRQYGVSHSTILLIQRGERWRSLP